MISIIASVAKNGVIGKDNKIPWHMTADLVRLKSLTKGKVVILGQKTYDSMVWYYDKTGREMPGKIYLVLTYDKNYKPARGNAAAVHSIEGALKEAEVHDEVMVAGGASIYRQFLPLADRMYLTLIDEDFDGDAHFPEWDEDEWEEVERVENEPDEKNPYRYTFLVLERRKTSASIQIFTDGASRNNPGNAAIAFEIYDHKGNLLKRHSEYIDRRTNNEAEYIALIKALEAGSTFSRGLASCFSDSKLLVNQMNGKDKIKKPHLRQLFSQVMEKAKLYKDVTYDYLPREDKRISRIDKLVNKELNKITRKGKWVRRDLNSRPTG